MSSIAPSAHPFTASDSLTVPLNKLLEWGVPLGDAKKIARTIAKYQAVEQLKHQRRSLRMRLLLPVYWRQLIEVGMPIDIARQVAEAIARYDTSHTPLTGEQKALIGKYCALVCRAELWRPGMLLG